MARLRHNRYHVHFRWQKLPVHTLFSVWQAPWSTTTVHIRREFEFLSIHWYFHNSTVHPHPDRFLPFHWQDPSHPDVFPQFPHVLMKKYDQQYPSSDLPVAKFFPLPVLLPVLLYVLPEAFPPILEYKILSLPMGTHTTHSVKSAGYLLVSTAHNLQPAQWHHIFPVTPDKAVLPPYYAAAAYSTIWQTACLSSIILLQFFLLQGHNFPVEYLWNCRPLSPQYRLLHAPG